MLGTLAAEHTADDRADRPGEQRTGRDTEASAGNRSRVFGREDLDARNLVLRILDHPDQAVAHGYPFDALEEAA